MISFDLVVQIAAAAGETKINICPDKVDGKSEKGGERM